jgi:hypothetical protein
VSLRGMCFRVFKRNVFSCIDEMLSAVASVRRDSSCSARAMGAKTGLRGRTATECQSRAWENGKQHASS